MIKKLRDILASCKAVEHTHGRSAAMLIIDTHAGLTDADKTIIRDELTKPPQVEYNVKELCMQKYGWYHPNLFLDIKEVDDDDGNKVKTVFIKNCLTNLSLIIQYLYPNLRFNKCDTFAYIDNKKIGNNDILEMLASIIEFLKGMNLTDIDDAVKHAAMQKSYNPIHEAFNNLNPENKDTHHIDNWLHTLCGAEDTELSRSLGKKWLVSAVARALNPGCYTEGALIFMGAQGSSKTYFLKSLVLVPDTYYGDRLDINNTQKCAQTLLGAHIVEMDELSAISNKEKEDYKSFLTRSSDKYVEKYSNFPTEVPRQCIFAGSTNDPMPLNDPTGSRRFWVIKVGTLDIARLKEIKDELWYEALQLYNLWNIKEYRATVYPYDPWVLTADERQLLDEHNTWFKVTDSTCEHLKATLPFIHHNADHMKKVQIRDGKMFVPFRLLKEIAKDYDKVISDKRLGTILSSLYTKHLSNGETFYVIQPDYSKDGNKSDGWGDV